MSSKNKRCSLTLRALANSYLRKVVCHPERSQQPLEFQNTNSSHNPSRFRSSCYNLGCNQQRYTWAYGVCIFVFFRERGIRPPRHPDVFNRKKTSYATVVDCLTDMRDRHLLYHFFTALCDSCELRLTLTKIIVDGYQQDFGASPVYLGGVNHFPQTPQLSKQLSFKLSFWQNVGC